MTRLHAGLRAAAGVVVLGLSLGGVAVLSEAAAASAAPVSPRTAPPGATVTPLVDCVVDGPIESGITARTIVFGYRNDSSVPVTTRAGTTENFITPGSPDRGQPTTFLPGEHHGTFSITINSDNGGSSFWVIGGNLARADAQGPTAPACSTFTTVALSAPAAAASGDFLTLSASVSRMFLNAPDAGLVSFAIDSGSPTVVAVDANGVARAVVSTPTQGGAHTISATYVPVTGSPLLGSQAQADISVSPATGALSVVPSGFSADKRQAFVTVSRASGIGAASVDYTTTDGTATAGVDYTASAGTVTLADGQLAATISIPVAARAAGAAESTFFVLLQRATTTVDAAGATVTLAAVPASPDADADAGTGAGSGAGGIAGSGRSGTGGGAADSVLPGSDPTATAPSSTTGSDLVVMLGAALLTIGGILGVFGLFKFGSTRNAQA
ncbi:Calx-beta domain-containing protein [Leifsonia sp. NPDC058230]|uniref:Calx-beta domain-containing protein n=1 Tax=Leifsonia sp. NPDC058230 TaxID=3346391 RepID=UPI0036DE6266